MSNTNEKTSIFINIKNIFMSILTVLLILIALIIVLQRFSPVTFFGFRMYVVATGSMEPVYNVGDVILSRQIDEKSIKIGDDIVYKSVSGSSSGKIITHRVVKIIEEDGQLIFQTKGVNNPKEDPEITGDQIYGKVISKLRIITFIYGLTESVYTMYFCIVVPVVFFVFFKIIHVSRRKGE